MSKNKQQKPKKISVSLFRKKIAKLFLIVFAILAIGGSQPLKIGAQVTIPDYSNVANWKLGNRPTLATIINSALKYIFVFAGLSVFALLIAGGFQLLTSGGNPENIKRGVAQITNAIIGFVIIFSTYWILQIVERVFGITIL